MKISLDLDAAYIFDLLAIEEVKEIKRPNESNHNSITIRQRLCDALSKERFYEIYNSEEYSEMMKVNGKIFDLIDDIRIYKKRFDAKIIDDQVIARFKAKNALQKKFFNNNISEQKFNLS